MAYRLAWGEPRAVVDLAHMGKFFARNLGGLTRARTCRTLSRVATSIRLAAVRWIARGLQPRHVRQIRCVGSTRARSNPLPRPSRMINEPRSVLLTKGTMRCRRCKVSLVLWVGATEASDRFASDASQPQQHGGSCDSRKFRLE